VTLSRASTFGVLRPMTRNVEGLRDMSMAVQSYLKGHSKQGDSLTKSLRKSRESFPSLSDYSKDRKSSGANPVAAIPSFTLKLVNVRVTVPCALSPSFCGLTLRRPRYFNGNCIRLISNVMTVCTGRSNGADA